MTEPRAGCLLAVRVTRRWMETPDIVALELQATDGQFLPAFEAGAHIDLHLPNGLVRPYSLCNAPRAGQPQPHYQVAVLREPNGRGGSACVHEALQPGCELQVAGPQNHFPLPTPLPTPAPVLLLAGGIGITPLLAMAEQLWEEGHAFELHSCHRSASRVPFASRLREVPWAARVHTHLDDGPAVQRLDLAALLAAAPEGTRVQVCGPAGFIQAVRNAASAQGWAADRVGFEHFAAPTTASQPNAAPAGSYELIWAPTGQCVPVAAGGSAAAALIAAGLPVALSCEQGICGGCLLKVLDGTPEHRDFVLSDAEQAAGDRFTPCCSGARSARLVVAPMSP
jgi:vanillate O-demethylase ferredoxin subunit